MDILNDILDTLALKGALYFRTDFSPPWSVTVPELGQAARFHLVVQGQLHVRFQSGDQAILNTGDMVLIPHGAQHVLSDSPVEEAPPLETVLADVGYDGSGVLTVGEGNPSAATQLLCGHFNFRDQADHVLLRALPDYMVTNASARATNPWLDDIIRLATRRIFSDSLGTDASVVRLSEMMFIELLRQGVEQGALYNARLEAFTDTHIGKALEHIHRAPDKAWTVEALASEVGMSRSSFAERFKTVLGMGPMTYLTDWRLQKAIALLDDSQFSVQQIANQTGYRSPAAFTRAFADKFGQTPTLYRQNLS